MPGAGCLSRVGIQTEARGLAVNGHPTIVPVVERQPPGPCQPARSTIHALPVRYLPVNERGNPHRASADPGPGGDRAWLARVSPAWSRRVPPRLFDRRGGQGVRSIRCRRPSPDTHWAWRCHARGQDGGRWRLIAGGCLRTRKGALWPPSRRVGPAAMVVKLPTWERALPNWSGRCQAVVKAQIPPLLRPQFVQLAGSLRAVESASVTTVGGWAATGDRQLATGDWRLATWYATCRPISYCCQSPVNTTPG